MRTRKGSLASDATGAEATGSPEEEGGSGNGTPAKEHRGEGPVGVASGRGLSRAPQSPLNTPPAGGRGHQVHKSWPTTVSDSEGSLDPSPGSGEGAWLPGGWPGCGAADSSCGQSRELALGRVRLTRAGPLWAWAA